MNTTETQEKIVRYLMLNTHLYPNISLYHGRMGIVLALYSFAERHDKKYISDFAWDMLQEVYKNVNDGMPVGLELGLSGIGYGVTALKKFGVFDCELNDVLTDVDSRIMQFDPRRMTELSYRAGMLGVWNYIRFRLQTESELTSLDGMFVSELKERMSHYGIDIAALQPKSVFDDLRHPTWDIGNYLKKNCGIDGGMGYYLLISEELKQ